jgi:hypothetical protein
MKGGRKIPTINAVAQFSALGEAEEFRRRLRLSGINASVVSRGKDGFEVTVPKDELEKLTPEEKEAVKRYLEHVAQTGDEEKKKAAEEVLRRFDFSAKAVNIGGIRLKLAQDRGKIKAEKYGDPQLIAEIKTALERKLREILGEKSTNNGKRPRKNRRGRKTPSNNTPTAPKTHAKPQHRQTQRKNLKTHKNKDTPPADRCAEDRKRGCLCRSFLAISLCLGVPFFALSARNSAMALLTASSSSASFKSLPWRCTPRSWGLISQC